MGLRSRIRAWGPVIGAGLTFLAIALAMLGAGHLTHSALLRASGSEAAFDGIYYLIGGTASLALARSVRHWLHCWSRQSLSLGACLLAVFFYGYGALTEANPSASGGQALFGLLLGPVYLVLNLYWHRRLEEEDDHHHAGFDAHLVVDAIASGVLAVGGLLAWFLMNGRINYWSAVAVLTVAVPFSLWRSWHIVSSMRHRAHNHPPKDDHHLPCQRSA